MTRLLVTGFNGEKSCMSDTAKKLSYATKVTICIKLYTTLASSMATKERSDTVSVNMSWEKATNVDALIYTSGTLYSDGCVGMDSNNAKWALLGRG